LEEGGVTDNMERLTRPPFLHGSWAALAFIEGKYSPPSAEDAHVSGGDFLGIYLSRVDPGIGLITFTGDGKHAAFHRCGEADSTAEFAMIDAFVHYEIPFDQWRIYPVGEPELAALERLEIREAHEKAMKGVAAVLYQARLSIRPGRAKLNPMFLLSPRSTEAILKDELTDKAIWRSLLGEEGAARYSRAAERLKEPRARTAADENGAKRPE
jgi:hypothetical protein